MQREFQENCLKIFQNAKPKPTLIVSFPEHNLSYFVMFYVAFQKSALIRLKDAVILSNVAKSIKNILIR